MTAVAGEVAGEVAGLSGGEEQAKVEVLRSTRHAGSWPDDAVVRPRLAGSATPSCGRPARCRGRRGSTRQGRGGWLRSCRGWQRWAEQLEKGGGEEHGGFRLLKNEEAPDGLAWYKFLAADGERRGREWRGGCWSWT